MINRLAAAAAGGVLRLVGPRRFKGKGRLVDHWLKHRDPGRRRIRAVAGGGIIRCDFSVPYEAMVWVRQEEETELRALSAWLRDGDHFVDCGANIGLWTLTAAASVGSSGRVTAFEPGPEAISRLRYNVAQSPVLCDRIHIVHAALSCRTGHAPFIVTDEHNTGRLAAAAIPGATTVEVTTLDESLGSNRVDGLKVDVEGSELDVLRGGEKVLRNQRPWIAIEFNTCLAGCGRIAEWDVFSFLGELEYTCQFVASPAGAIPGRTVGAHERMRGYVNLLFIPAERDIRFWQVASSRC